MQLWFRSFFSSSLHSLLPTLPPSPSLKFRDLRHRIEYSSMIFRCTTDGCFWTPLSESLHFPSPPFFALQLCSTSPLSLPFVFYSPIHPQTQQTHTAMTT